MRSIKLVSSFLSGLLLFWCVVSRAAATFPVTLDFGGKDVAVVDRSGSDFVVSVKTPFGTWAREPIVKSVCTTRSRQLMLRGLHKVLCSNDAQAVEVSGVLVRKQKVTAGVFEVEFLVPERGLKVVDRRVGTTNQSSNDSSDGEKRAGGSGLTRLGVPVGPNTESQNIKGDAPTLGMRNNSVRTAVDGPRKQPPTAVAQLSDVKNEAAMRQPAGQVTQKKGANGLSDSISLAKAQVDTTPLFDKSLSPRGETVTAEADRGAKSTPAKPSLPILQGIKAPRSFDDLASSVKSFAETIFFLRETFTLSVNGVVAVWESEHASAGSASSLAVESMGRDLAAMMKEFRKDCSSVVLSFDERESLESHLTALEADGYRKIVELIK